MKPPRHIPLPLTALLLTAVSLLSPPAPPVRADNTLRGKRLTLSSSSRDAIAGIKISPVTPSDTLRNPSRDSIQASGYDKPLRTNRETLLITNATARQAQRPRAHPHLHRPSGPSGSTGAPTPSTPTYRPVTHACFGSPHGTPSNPTTTIAAAVPAQPTSPPTTSPATSTSYSSPDTIK